MSDSQLPWLELNLALGDSLRFLRVVLDRYRTPAEALAAPALELRSLGLDEEHVDLLTSPALLGRAQEEFDRLRRKGYSLVTFEDGGYPAALKDIFDPPCVLTCAGLVEALRGPAVAIVGTRNPTPYGTAVAERLAGDLASRGIVIVSGMALGIDTAAHRGALKEGGRTVAVLGSGFNRMYPRENRRLFESIREAGAAVSEFPLDAEPISWNFPRRNRIISGLSLAVVVVEAAERSGALITASFALDQGREAMAVPGNVTSSVSRGTNGLLRQGARLVEGWEDVAEELPSPWRETLLRRKEGPPAPLPLLNEREAAVFGLLAVDTPTPVDELVERTGLSVTELLTLLLDLEFRGLIRRGPGPYYLRRP